MYDMCFGHFNGVGHGFYRGTNTITSVLYVDVELKLYVQL